MNRTWDVKINTRTHADTTSIINRLHDHLEASATVVSCIIAREGTAGDLRLSVEVAAINPTSAEKQAIREVHAAMTGIGYYQFSAPPRSPTVYR